MTALVLTFIGRDRPGLVRAIASRVAGKGGLWLESRLVRLAGQFAGVVRVEAAPERVAELSAALHGLEVEGLKVTIATAEAETRETPELLSLELLCLDRPGIVSEVAAALTALEVNIEEFESEVVAAAFTGQPMFKASARLSAPAGLALETLRQRLETLAAEMMADLSLT